MNLDDAFAAISVPPEVDTPLGVFTSRDGLPTEDTVTAAYDTLDLMRGVEAFLSLVPGASMSAMRSGLRSAAVTRCTQIGITDPRLNSGTLYLTPNTDTVYGHTFLDLAEGPVVVEAPPNSLCVVDDFWFRYVTDMGLVGPDGGAGGAYLFVPPGYQDEPPDGYYVCQSPTFTNWAMFRALGGLEDLRTVRVYPLAQADDPPVTEFVDIADIAHSTVHANDFSFYEEVDRIVQEEPLESLDPERRGLLAAIGIVKGRPFQPDERMRRILGQAAPLGAVIARTLVYKPRDPEAYYYPGSSWKRAFVGGSHEFLHEGAALLDARTALHYFATVITPAMVAAAPGTGSQYAYTAEDSTGAWLDGARSYRLHLPAPIPAKNFWSVCLYDCQTRSLLQTDNPYPSLGSLSGTVTSNDDDSVDVYFGPRPPTGTPEGNWIQTVPGKAWFTLLRLYGPLDPWFDQTWRPGEIEPID